MCKIALKIACLAMLGFVIAGIGGCSGSGAEFGVNYNSKLGNIEIILNPPGESKEYTQDGKIQAVTHISKPPGGQAIEINTYNINLKRTFKESGNVYQIVGSIDYDNSNDKPKLIAYNLTVTGGVYGNTPRSFKK